jgi:hypothetical protein
VLHGIVYIIYKMVKKTEVWYNSPVPYKGLMYKIGKKGMQNSNWKLKWYSWNNLCSSVYQSNWQWLYFKIMSYQGRRDNDILWPRQFFKQTVHNTLLLYPTKLVIWLHLNGCGIKYKHIERCCPGVYNGGKSQIKHPPPNHTHKHSSSCFYYNTEHCFSDTL